MLAMIRILAFLSLLSVSLSFVAQPAFHAMKRSSFHHHCDMASKPTLGDIVTIDCDAKPEGDFVPEPLIDTHGKLTFVLGGGNYLPGLHDVVANMSVGETVENVSLDAGWGSRNPNLVATIQKKEMGDQIDVDELKVGVELYLVNGMKAVVTEVTADTFTIDANPPLAGSSYNAKVTLLSIEDGPKEMEYVPEGVQSTYNLATFALGCFWGGELEFMRQNGVVGTKVGYTQGLKPEPTYKEVCSGTTGDTEAIMVTYDPRVVSYRQLVTVAMERLGTNKFLLNQVGNDRGTQYRHGIYYHDDMQKEIAEEIVRSFGPECKTEVLPARKFWDGEDYHQQYLLKGGQSARKGDSSTIRCYG
jgi:peptide-methionine (S)-S-oxide reductase